jgi:hypothetical protein
LKVSVGIPSHNQGQFLTGAIDALLRQTVPPDEIIISDDHSTDGSDEVLRRYEGRVRVIRQPERLSMVEHFDSLVGQMNSDWFAVLGGDDIAGPRFVEHLSRAATRERDAVLVRGGWAWLSQSGRRLGHHRLWSTASVTRAPRSFLEELHGPKACLSAVLFRRSAWLEIGGFPASLTHSFDWGAYLRLSAIGAFVTTHRIVCGYRTGYPTTRVVDRLIDKAHDERAIALEIAPMVARELGLSAEPAMRRAAEFRLESMLLEAELATDADVRARVAAELRPLAVALGRESLVDGYAAGEPVASSVHMRKLASGVLVLDARLRSVRERLARRPSRG